ncbi:MAG: helix-turn-helix transcriptional regulator [Planctomycetota bacterium]
MSVSETLRAAVKAEMRRGTTRYRIAEDSGVDLTALSRFLTEDRHIRASTVDALAEYLGLELGPKRAGKGPK